ncbi:hypothetical protein [Arundinibacter roseus]|uniref:Uncharacterized protein n=1 Tax=Arundinibacter roseus TaxID=2070510 RepID=A0A4R4KL60_9BACT|nr:hypothetical protein [Arundinibacter roseus]TDB69077.1 hypothetical protein EZE20_01715 [Arundinibacter roseus]
MGKENFNQLGRLFYRQPGSKQLKIKEDLVLYNQKWGRFRYWFTVPDERLVEIPTILKTIACKNMPQAEEFFKLKNTAIPTLFSD